MSHARVSNIYGVSTKNSNFLRCWWGSPSTCLGAAGWAPGDSCPNCGHSVVHAIVRAGMVSHDTGRWEFDGTLGVDLTRLRG